MTTATPEKLPSYEVTIVLKAKTPPNRWIQLVMEDALNDGEEIVHVHVREVEGV